MKKGKKVTFAKYNLTKWTIDEDICEKTKRNKEITEIIDMREKNIEEELVNKHEETFTKKELCDKRMASRDLAIQGLCNPFMFNNNYLEDLNNQDQFLRPQNSNYKNKKE